MELPTVRHEEGSCLRLERGKITKVDTFERARRLLQDYAKQQKNACFRGEAQPYPSTAPSVCRLNQEIGDAFSIYLNPNLALHIFDEKIRHLVENRMGFTTLNGVPFGCPNLADDSYECEPRHVMRGLDGLLQHYGFPTNWIDIARDFEPALIFANQHNESSLCRVFFGDFTHFEGHGKVIDIAKFAAQLRQIIPIDASRPEQQSGLAVRLYDNSSFRDFMYCVEFPKSPIVPDATELYPLDGLGTWLKGLAIDYRFDVRKRIQINRESSDEIYRMHLDKIEICMSHLNLL